MEIKTTPIGSINGGIDGKDDYILVKRLDDDITEDVVTSYLLPQVYYDTNRPGGRFCHSITVTVLPSGNEAIAIVHHRYDV